MMTSSVDSTIASISELLATHQLRVSLWRDRSGGLGLEVARANGPVALIPMPGNLPLSPELGIMILALHAATIEEGESDFDTWARRNGGTADLPLECSDETRRRYEACERRMRDRFEETVGIRRALRSVLGDAYSAIVAVSQRATVPAARIGTSE